MKCIILAGGSGERLWPVSRELYPKSLLKLYNGNTLLQNTYELAAEIVKEKDIITITNIRQLDDIRLELKKVSKKPVIIAEPMSKNTAPAIASALSYIQSSKDEIVLILPVDFSVEDKQSFIESVNAAKKTTRGNYIVTFGVKPSYFEEGFGYIQTGKELKTGYKVERFIEKPKNNEFEKSINNENIFWNCGIYAGKVSVIMKSLQKYSPQVCSNFSKEMFDENNKIKYEYYENIPEISIDYAVMEKADNLAFIELQTKWADYGSWRALYNNSEKDSKGNVISGNVLSDNIKNSFIYSSKELVAVSGMNNTIVIETEDAVLVCDKSKSSEINKIVRKLKQEDNPSVISRKTVFRPWGFYTCLNGGNGWLSKIITVSPEHKLSLQSHNYRSEHWVVLEGTATVILNDNKHVLQKCQSIDIPVKAKHSLQNHTKTPLKILEVQKGDYIGEDDIIRYEDMYGRLK